MITLQLDLERCKPFKNGGGKGPELNKSFPRSFGPFCLSQGTSFD